MDVIIALVFFSLILVAAGLAFFFSRLFAGDFEHGERLSLLPLADDETIVAETDDADSRRPDGDRAIGTIKERSIKWMSTRDR